MLQCSHDTAALETDAVLWRC